MKYILKMMLLFGVLAMPVTTIPVEIEEYESPVEEQPVEQLAEKKFFVMFKFLTGKTVTLDVKADATGAEIKKMLQEKGEENVHLILVYAGKSIVKAT